MENSAPHPHAVLIKAWADGAKIQTFDKQKKEWMDLDNPRWHSEWEYRIKPHFEDQAQRRKARSFRLSKMIVKHSSAHKPIYKDARRTHGFMPLGTKAKKIHWPSL